MTLGIAICTRNRPSELARCLKSIVANSGQSPIQQVVVSSDGLDESTDDVVWKAADQLPNLSYLRGPRAGLAANRNNCVRAIVTEYVLFLDDDAMLTPSFLPSAMPLAGKATIVTGWESLGDRRVDPHDPDFYGFQRLPAGPSPRSIVINSTIFPTEFLRRVPFDEFYRYGCDELDIATAARAYGMRIVRVNSGNAHLKSAESRGGRDRLEVRSHVYYSVRRYSRYEPSLVRLGSYLLLGPAKLVRHELSAQGPSRAPTVVADVAAGLFHGLQWSRPRAHLGTVCSEEADRNSR